MQMVQKQHCARDGQCLRTAGRSAEPRGLQGVCASASCDEGTQVLHLYANQSEHNCDLGKVGVAHRQCNSQHCCASAGQHQAICFTTGGSYAGALTPSRSALELEAIGREQELLLHAEGAVTADDRVAQTWLSLCGGDRPRSDLPCGVCAGTRCNCWRHGHSCCAHVRQWCMVPQPGDAKNLRVWVVPALVPKGADLRNRPACRGSCLVCGDKQYANRAWRNSRQSPRKIAPQTIRGGSGLC